MNLQLLSRLKTRDAAVLYEYLFEQNNRVAGELRGLSFDSIAAELNAAGLTTARGSKFTAQVVRNRFSELEDVEIVSKTEIAPGYFNLYIFVYPGVKTEEPVETSEEKDEYNGRTLFENLHDSDAITTGRAPISHSAASHSRFQIEIEIENENGNCENENAHKEEYINKTNKQILNCSEEQDQVQAETVNDVVARTDFSNDKVSRFRKRVARDVYEAGLHADLVDRAVAAVVKRFATVHELQAAICESREEVRLLQTTNGFRGKRKIWETFCRRVKDWFDCAGVLWVPTSNRREPEPEALFVTGDDSFEERILAHDAEIRKRAASMFRPMRRAVC